MHRLLWIHGDGIARIHFQSVSGLDLAGAGVNILGKYAIVLNLQGAQRRCHPTILIAMIVNRACLSHLPADCDQFIEIVLIDEVSRVVLAIPDEIRRETLWVYRMFAQKTLYGINLLKAGCR